MKNEIIHCAYQALIDEVTLSPKPGLVSPFDTGSHTDMDIQHFLKSAQALKPYFEAYFDCGLNHQGTPDELMNKIRTIGMDAEHAMLEATGNINTHKGANFLFGVVLSAIGYGTFPDIPSLISLIQTMTHGLVHSELTQNPSPSTYGEIIYKKYGISGIRGETESGLTTIITLSLPIMRQEEKNYELKLKEALLELIKINPDTNMIKRGGPYGLTLGKQLARLPYTDIDTHLFAMNNLFKIYNLSPGGSADLLSLTAFLYNYERLYMNKERQSLTISP